MAWGDQHAQVKGWIGIAVVLNGGQGGFLGGMVDIVCHAIRIDDLQVKVLDRASYVAGDPGQPVQTGLSFSFMPAAATGKT